MFGPCLHHLWACTFSGVHGFCWKYPWAQHYSGSHFWNGTWKKTVLKWHPLGLKCYKILILPAGLTFCLSNTKWFNTAPHFLNIHFSNRKKKQNLFVRRWSLLGSGLSRQFRASISNRCVFGPHAAPALLFCSPQPVSGFKLKKALTDLRLLKATFTFLICKNLKAIPHSNQKKKKVWALVYILWTYQYCSTPMVTLFWLSSIPLTPTQKHCLAIINI